MPTQIPKLNSVTILFIVLATNTFVTTSVHAAVKAPKSTAIYGSAEDGPDNVDGQFGPYDYYRPPSQPPAAIALVERAHLGYVVAEQLFKKDYCGYYLNLDYTLRALPNHPKALTMMAKYLESHATCPPSRKDEVTTAAAVIALESGTWQERDMTYYFETAINFMTEDTRVIPRHAETHVLYGDWLRKSGNYEKAQKQYETAISLKPGFTDAYYGMGMMYLDQKNTAKAAEYAKQAYSTGKPPPELRDRLVASGVWQAPPSGKQNP
jgi:tetratricopeptide (TPR) repeat protein